MGFRRGFLSFFLSFLLILCLFVLGIITSISLTILNPQFVTSELDKLDIYSAVTDTFASQLQIEGAREVIDTIITDLKPWLKEQKNTVIYKGYSYLKGNQELNIVIHLEQLKLTLKENLSVYASTLLPPELAGVSEDFIEIYMKEAFNEIDTLIPERFEITEASLSSEITTVLHQAKQIVSYIKLAYVLSVVLSIIMILLIAIIHNWQTKPLARFIGTSFTTVGITTAIVVIIVRASNIIADLFAHYNEIIPTLQEKLTPLITEITTPLLIYSIAFLVTGIILVMLSFLVKSTEYKKVLM